MSSLSMARGAGKLKIGAEAVKDAVRKGAPLVLVTADTAERTKHSIREECGSETAFVEADLTQEDIEEKFGWKFGVAAVTDPNLARLIQKNAAALQEELNAH